MYVEGLIGDFDWPRFVCAGVGGWMHPVVGLGLIGNFDWLPFVDGWWVGGCKQIAKNRSECWIRFDCWF